MEFCTCGGAIYNAHQLIDEVKNQIGVIAKAVSLGDTYAGAVKEMKSNGGFSYNQVRQWLFSESDNYERQDYPLDDIKLEKGKTVTLTSTFCPTDVAAAILKSDVYRKLYLDEYAESGERWTFKNSGTETQVWGLFLDCARLFGDIEITDGEKTYTMPGIDFYRTAVTSWDSLSPSERTRLANSKAEDEYYNADLHELYKDYVNIFDQYILKKSVSRQGIITNLASYFKETSWGMSESGWVANKSVIQNALMYAILVVQSLIFFIAYAKRLFYVILLILVAPIVVVFDFFTKFGGK
ncbi:MAG: hypothetical protein IKV94_05805 [Clostridia bacterium]|nr:hypothetical protein [Clostridia bacterium]